MVSFLIRFSTVDKEVSFKPFIAPFLLDEEEIVPNDVA